MINHILKYKQGIRQAYRNMFLKIDNNIFNILH